MCNSGKGKETLAGRSECRGRRMKLLEIGESGVREVRGANR